MGTEARGGDGRARRKHRVAKGRVVRRRAATAGTASSGHAGREVAHLVGPFPERDALTFHRGCRRFVSVVNNVFARGALHFTLHMDVVPQGQECPAPFDRCSGHGTCTVSERSSTPSCLCHRSSQGVQECPSPNPRPCRRADATASSPPSQWGTLRTRGWYATFPSTWWEAATSGRGHCRLAAGSTASSSRQVPETLCASKWICRHRPARSRCC